MTPPHWQGGRTAMPVDRPTSLDLSHHGRVLVVDSDPVDIEEMSTLLKREGHRVLTAADGPPVAALIARERPDVIVLDVALPSFSGFELCRLLKQDP